MKVRKLVKVKTMRLKTKIEAELRELFMKNPNSILAPSPKKGKKSKGKDVEEAEEIEEVEEFEDDAEELDADTDDFNEDEEEL